MKPDDPERLLREQRDRLLIWAFFHGPREDFARFYTPRLRLGDREVEPAFVQNERTAVRKDDGRYLARCVYGFATRNLTGTSRVALVVRDADGRDEIGRASCRERAAGWGGGVVWQDRREDCEA